MIQGRMRQGHTGAAELPEVVQMVVGVVPSVPVL